jgi:hypothetical protein
MREHPWHLRRATAQHHLWYRNLMELQRVTQGWLKEINVERPTHFLGHSSPPEVRETIARLEGLADVALRADTEGGLDQLLDDTWPEDLLGRLQNGIETLQAWTLRMILERLAGNEDARAAQIGALEQSTWRAGRDCAALRWKGSDATSREDLRYLLAAFRGNPLNPARLGPPVLVERALRNELSMQLLQCPHRSTNAARLVVADTLCSLHDQWIRGFVYELNPRVRIETSRSGSDDGRCRHRWWLPS